LPKRSSAARPGPGRPTAARIEAINNAIIAKARAEFRRIGFEASKMEAIAAAAGVSKATLYGRYPTKDALLQAVIAQQVATWSDEWEPKDGPMPADLRKRLKHRAHVIMDYYCSGQLEVLERLFTGGPSMHELRRERYEVGHQRTIRLIAEDIVEGSARRPIKSRAATQLADMLITMLYGWWRTHQEVRRVTSKEAFAFVDYAVDVLFDGRSAWTRSTR
jgi:TetR/AcrR family transcriptional repressor of mexJK operon